MCQFYLLLLLRVKTRFILKLRGLVNLNEYIFLIEISIRELFPSSDTLL